MMLIGVTGALALVWFLSCALTLLSFSGVWLTILAAMVLQLWHPETYSWWTLGAVSALALLGELIEIFGSAAVARSAGGTKTAAFGSVIGGIVGAILGTIFLPIPIVGTLLGAVVGAGALAMLGQRASSPDRWGTAVKVGTAAAKGRFVSLVIKGMICVLAGVVLLAALWI
jgi:uncharacterized protein